MRRAALSLTLLSTLLVAVPDARAQGLDLRIGGFLPRLRDCGVPSSQPAEYTLFQDVCELYAVDENAFDGLYGGIEYNHVIARNVEVAVHVDGSSETVDTFYRDYERPGGTNIFQTLRLRTAPLGVSLRLVPTSKRVKVAPFVGGGVDAIFYQYEEWGDFIDSPAPRASTEIALTVLKGSALSVPKGSHACAPAPRNPSACTRRV